MSVNVQTLWIIKNKFIWRKGNDQERDKDRQKELLVFYDGTKTMVVSSKKTRTKQTVNNDAKRTAHWLLVCIFKEVGQALDNQ